MQPTDPSLVGFCVLWSTGTIWRAHDGSGLRHQGLVGREVSGVSSDEDPVSSHSCPADSVGLGDACWGGIAERVLGTSVPYGTPPIEATLRPGPWRLDEGHEPEP